jgi:hypothetical protein
VTNGQVGGKECKNNKICLRPLWIVYTGVVFKVIMLATATCDMRQPLLHLPWPPWALRQRYDHFYWPRKARKVRHRAGHHA